MSKYPSYALYTCCRSNAGITNLIDNDNNTVLVPSFNDDLSKEYEVKENLVYLEVVQNAFAHATQKDDMGSNGSKL